MPSSGRSNFLPLWKPAASAVEDTNSADGVPSSQDEAFPTMILVAIPEGLRSVLRAIVRDVDGVDSELRAKISEHLPSAGDDDPPATAVSAAQEAKDRDRRSVGRQPLALPPATLARALPHIRRLAPPTMTGSGFLAMCHGGGLVFPNAKAGVGVEPEKDEEAKRTYKERRERLLLLQEQKEYARMTSNIQRAPRETVRDIQASFNFQAGMGANMVLAVVTAFIISYWASKFLVGDNTAHRMVIGLVGAVFMMLIELLVFVTRSMKADLVVKSAREEAERTHTAVGVHRSGVGGPRRGGRGVLDMKGSDRKGEYELVPPGIGGDAAGAAPSRDDGSDSDEGIRRGVRA